MLNDLADGVSMVVRWIIACAPFGILGLMFSAVASSGLDIFTHTSQLRSRNAILCIRFKLL